MDNQHLVTRAESVPGSEIKDAVHEFARVNWIEQNAGAGGKAGDEVHKRFVGFCVAAEVIIKVQCEVGSLSKVFVYFRSYEWAVFKNRDTMEPGFWTARE